MFTISADEAFKAVAARKDRAYHFPGKPDGRYRHGGLFPHLYPKFRLTPEDRIFTMGSCFARHIEDALLEQGFQLPVKAFTLPEGELPYPGPHLLNEYNAGTIAQRIRGALGQGFPDAEAGIEIGEEGALDLLLHIASKPVSLERLHARRKEIHALYGQMVSSDCLVLTLGLVEAWYDNAHGCYLNRAPAYRKLRAQPGRYAFHRFDVEDVVGMLKPTLHDLLAGGLQKVLLTVSPVPMEVSFMPGDIVTNNTYSKATLRASCELLSRGEPAIDYFPSYEIVTSFGVENGFIDDGVHPRMEVVDRVISHLADHYLPWGIRTQAEVEEIFAGWQTEGRRVLLYPAGQQAWDLFWKSPTLRASVVAFGDQNHKLWSDGLFGLPVLSPAAITPEQVDLVLIASHQHEEAIHAELAPVQADGIELFRSSALRRRTHAGDGV